MKTLCIAFFALTLATAAWGSGPAPGAFVSAAGDSSAPDSLAVPPDVPTPPPVFRIELFPERASRRSHRPEEFPTERPGNERARIDRIHVLTASAGLRYNRVEGLAMEVSSERLLDDTRFIPGYHTGLGYTFSSRRWLYRVGLEQPLAPRHKITLGAEAFRSTESFFYDDVNVGDGENSASAFFLHRDYRDWYEAEGGRAWIGGYPSPFLRIAAGIVTRDESSLPQETDWSLFRQSADFRPNPKIEDGNYRGYEVEIAYDDQSVDNEGHPLPRQARRGIEHTHRLLWERADPALDGDFNLHRVTLDSRVYFRLTPDQSVALRLLAGTGGSTTGILPPQRRFRLGGLGTLRGHSLHSLSGDHVFLGNMEYEFGLFEQNDGLVFVDAGTAWDEGNLSKQRFAVDVGGGIRLGEGITLVAARNVNDADADVKVHVRFQETY